jgi:hypothetical protein
MSLCRRIVTRVKRAVANDAWRESGDSSARAHSDAAENLTGAGVGHGRSAQNGEILR